MKCVVQPVILSGGSGTRLWPLSRRAFPKQFIPLIGDDSLFQQTIMRLSHGLFSNPMILGSNEHRFIIAEQLRELGISPEAIVLEPCARNTAPAALIAALRIAEISPEQLILLLPSDHKNIIYHSRVYRPWGWYERLEMGERFQVKCLMVKPGEKLSLQSHHHRAEHWVVVSGTARVTVGDKVSLLSENESTYIPIGALHRLENPGQVPALLIEVQSGSYLGEDDIVRYEDVYNRNAKINIK